MTIVSLGSKRVTLPNMHIFAHDRSTSVECGVGAPADFTVIIPHTHLEPIVCLALEFM